MIAGRDEIRQTKPSRYERFAARRNSAAEGGTWRCKSAWGALLKCSFGLMPSSLVVMPANHFFTVTPDANIMDHMPMLNIMPFGMCTTQSNPAVAAATAAAMGTPTPAPCVPATPAPWTPGAPTVILGMFPTLNSTSTLNRIWGGVITISQAGEQTVNVP